jgi:hypothetical protein
MSHKHTKHADHGSSTFTNVFNPIDALYDDGFPILVHVLLGGTVEDCVTVHEEKARQKINEFMLKFHGAESK